MKNNASDNTQPKILIVDWDPKIRNLVDVSLSKIGYTVIETFNDVGALEQVEKEKPDLIILDVIAPPKGGFAILGELKRDSKNINIPIIMLTSRKSNGNDIYGPRGWDGVSAYLIKPINPSELIYFAEKILS